MRAISKLILLLMIVSFFSLMVESKSIIDLMNEIKVSKEKNNLKYIQKAKLLKGISPSTKSPRIQSIQPEKNQHSYPVATKNFVSNILKNYLYLKRNGLL